MRHPFPSDEVKAEFSYRTGTPIRVLSHRAGEICCSELGLAFPSEISQILVAGALPLVAIPAETASAATSAWF